MKEYKLAVNTINNAIKLAPSIGHYYLLRGGLYINMNDFVNAKPDIEKALSLQLNELDKNSCSVYMEAINENIH